VDDDGPKQRTRSSSRGRNKPKGSNGDGRSGGKQPTSRGVSRNKSSDSVKGATTSKTKSKGGSDTKKQFSKQQTNKSSDVSMRSDLSSSHPTNIDFNVHENIPSEYLRDPDSAEPILYHLPKTAANNGMLITGTTPTASKTSATTPAAGNNKFINLRVLLAAAEEDIRLHRARQQAGRHRDSRLLKSYKIETDQNWLARQQRLNERDLLLGKLRSERTIILKELLAGNTAGLTAKEATAIQLARWQRALELYVYDPPTTAGGGTTAGTSMTASMTTASATTDDASTAASEKAAADAQGITTNLDFLGLLEKLMESSGEVRPKFILLFGY
jgi:hypothetical protein